MKTPLKKKQKIIPENKKLAQASPAINKFWNFKPPEEGSDLPAELILYGDISSSSWWGDKITPQIFSDELIALGDVDEIVVRINSGGGDVFAAYAIHTRLKDHAAFITVKIDGWAASAATIIAMAGDKILIPAYASYLIHNPAMGVRGYCGEDDFLRMHDELKTIKNSIVGIYASKTGKSTDEIIDLMKVSTTYDGIAAVENGFCDELMFNENNAIIENAANAITNSVFNKQIAMSVANQYTNHLAAMQGGFVNNKHLTQQKESEKAMDFKTVEELKAAHPNFVMQIENDAKSKERKRIKDIEDVTIDGFEEIVQAAKFDSPVEASSVAMRILAVQKEQGARFLSGRENDVKNSGINGVKNDGIDLLENEANPFEAAIDSVLPKIK